MLVLEEPQLPRSRALHSEVRRPLNRVALSWLSLPSVEHLDHSLRQSWALEDHGILLAMGAVLHERLAVPAWLQVLPVVLVELRPSLHLVLEGPLRPVRYSWLVTLMTMKCPEPVLESLDSARRLRVVSCCPQL